MSDDGIELYVGELRTARTNDIYGYKIFDTYMKALEWCLNNTQRLKYKDGRPYAPDMYDIQKVRDRVYYGEFLDERFAVHYDCFFSVRKVSEIMEVEV